MHSIESPAILQDIYNSEINFSVSTQWDAGFDFKLGDSYNGYQAEGTFRTIAEGTKWLVSEIIVRYPESDFTKKYKTQLDWHRNHA